MKISYKITFHSDWHCGSGLAAGADLDALVVKDKNGMPFIPGKTLKGLIREATEELLFLTNQFDENADELKKVFGNATDRNVKESNNNDYDDMAKGETFFANATLSENEYKAIVCNKAQKFLFRSVASTRIDKEGIAVEHSLRKMEVTIPCTLESSILSVPDAMAATLVKAMGYIKRLGQNRNRGLGRCSFTDIKIEGE